MHMHTHGVVEVDLPHVGGDVQESAFRDALQTRQFESGLDVVTRISAAVRFRGRCQA